MHDLFLLVSLKVDTHCITAWKGEKVDLRSIGQSKAKVVYNSSQASAIIVQLSKDK